MKATNRPTAWMEARHTPLSSWQTGDFLKSTVLGGQKVDKKEVNSWNKVA
jgi:hypothetical protein